MPAAPSPCRPRQGTVALVNTTTPLTCKTAADCAADSRIIDLVGYGSAVVRETAPAAATSNTTSAARTALTDTDNNANDFSVGSPTPQNSSDNPPPPPPLGPHPRHPGRRAPVAPGRHDGPGAWDRDRGPRLRLGPRLLDAGCRTRRRRGDQRGHLRLHGIEHAERATGRRGDRHGHCHRVLSGRPRSTRSCCHDRAHRAPPGSTSSTGNTLPAAEPLGPTTVPTTYTREPGGSIESFALEPTQYALDFFESREGMRVQVTDARVVGPTTPFNELFVTTKPAEHPTVRGGTLYGGYDQQNSGRLLVQSLIPFAQRPFPQVDVGDSSGRNHRRAGRLQPLRRLHDPGDRARHRDRAAASSERPPASRTTTSSPSPPTTSRTSIRPTPATSSHGWPRASSRT